MTRDCAATAPPPCLICSGDTDGDDLCPAAMVLRHGNPPHEKEAVVEDHRASTDHEPRSIYGKIVAEADRIIDPDITLRRTVQYGLKQNPAADKGGTTSGSISISWQNMHPAVI